MDLQQFLNEWHDGSERLLVHTSGSTGRPKPLWVEKRRMEASARITCQFLGLKPGDSALLCLPLDYIAGKMMVVRALTCGLQLIEETPGSHPLAHVDDTVTFAAMIPLQVARSLEVPVEAERLRAISHLIIGGGAIDPQLEATLRDFPHAVWSTYGMTETLSHIALRRINGPEATEWYTPFDGVGVSLNEEGCLVIDAPAVCETTLTTNDRAEMNNGRFRILGRRDNVVCSGGIKIQIEEVERRLSPYIKGGFMITKRRDPLLGEALVLLTDSGSPEALHDICRQYLPRYWQPRYILHVDALPLTPNGKPARQEAELLANSGQAIP